MEENLEKTDIYRFKEFELDAEGWGLRCAGKRMTTQPNAFERLRCLICNRHSAVDKDKPFRQLHSQRGWPRRDPIAWRPCEFRPGLPF